MRYVDTLAGVKVRQVVKDNALGKWSAVAEADGRSGPPALERKGTRKMEGTWEHGENGKKGHHAIWSRR